MTHLDRRALLGASLGLAAAPSALSQDFIPFDEAKDKPGATKNTKFAANVEMWWGRLPFLDRIKAAAAMGFPAFEMWPHRGKDIDAIADLSGELGIECAQFTAWGFSPGMNDAKNHDAVEKEIEASCKVANKLRAKKATVIAGNDIAGVSQEAMLEQVVVALKRVAPIAEAHDVMLILEPMNIRVDHKGHCLYGSVDATNICREVGSTHVKINWDLYHMQISEGDLCGRMKDGIDQIGYLQLADHPGRYEPGTGEIHYARVLRAAKELGYTGYVGLECRPMEGEAKAAQRIHDADNW